MPRLRQKAGESSQSVNQQIFDDLNSKRSKFIHIFKMMYTTADASKPEAEPKDTEDEDTKRSQFHDFLYDDLNLTQQKFLEDVFEKYCDEDGYRYPWVESVTIKERQDWTVAFCAVAISFGFKQEEISIGVYKGNHPELVRWAWRQAEEKIALLK
jgi:hypothetical protein